MREARAPFPLLCCRAPHCASDVEGGSTNRMKGPSKRAAGDAVLSQEICVLCLRRFSYGGRVHRHSFQFSTTPQERESGTRTRTEDMRKGERGCVI